MAGGHGGEARGRGRADVHELGLEAAEDGLEVGDQEDRGEASRLV